MSIHKSKGLEFPIVFLAGTTKRFNLMDTHKPLLIHAGLGIGPKRVDLDRRIEYPTLARMAVSQIIRRETVAEELRVLYVGMTRAREKLIITASYNDALRELDKMWGEARPLFGGGMSPLRRKCGAGSGFGRLILLPALRRQEQRRCLVRKCPRSMSGSGRCGTCGRRASTKQTRVNRMTPL